MIKLYSNCMYDEFSNEWNYTIYLNDDNDCFVRAKKSCSFNQVSFIIPYNNDYIRNALNELDKRVNL